jgi:single-strand DNA-binding protein
MAQGETPVTIVGNVVAEPELRFTPSGAAVTSFRVASTPRYFNKEANEWTDGEPLFMTCNAWRNLGENVAETLSKGMRVIVQGNMKQRNWEDKEGAKRSTIEVEVSAVGPELTWAKATVERVSRDSGNRDSGGRPPVVEPSDSPF